MGTIQTPRNKWADSETIDLIVIVGEDNQEGLNKMAHKVGGEIYLDNSGSVIKGLGGRGVPHWFVLNSDNEVLRHFSRYYASINEQIKRLEL